MNKLQSFRWVPLAIAALAALLLFMSGTGVKLELWTFSTGFTMLRWAAYLGIGAAVSAALLLVLLRPRGSTLAMLLGSLLVGVTTAGMPWQQRRAARGVPPIHDITTDLGNPPEFIAILPLRADAPNSAVYEGEEIAAQQRAAYPDVLPLNLETTPAEAFTRALDAAREMGWELVVADSVEGRIEAVATTRWFGFKDDVVVRLTPDGSRTRIDVRSVSRVGRSDVGANAKRIREYVKLLAP